MIPSDRFDPESIFCQFTNIIQHSFAVGATIDKIPDCVQCIITGQFDPIFNQPGEGFQAAVYISDGKSAGHVS